MTHYYYYLSDVITLDRWNHLAATQDSSDVVLYVNGESIGSDTFTTNINEHTGAGNVRLGEDDAGNYDLEGGVALPRVYNRVLSALEIQSLFNREKHLFGVW